MTGFPRVHEECGRTGAGQGGGNLAGNVTGLAHAGYHDPAMAFQHQPAGCHERGFSDFVFEPFDGARLGIDYGEGEPLQLAVVHVVLSTAVCG